MGAALASATVNFAYQYTESGHNVIAGGYLALLSLFGMVMFHEFQFEDGTATSNGKSAVRAALAHLAHKHPVRGHRLA